MAAVSKTANFLAESNRKATHTPSPEPIAAPVSTPAASPADARKAARQEAALIAARQMYTTNGGKTGKDADTFFKYFGNDYRITSENGNVLATPLDDDGNEIADARKPFNDVLAEARTTPIYSGFFAPVRQTTGGIRNNSMPGAPAAPAVVNADGSTNWAAAAAAIK